VLSISVVSTRYPRLRQTGLVEKSVAERWTGRGDEVIGGLGVRLLRETWWAKSARDGGYRSASCHLDIIVGR
jgi:hypothetical protein